MDATSLEALDQTKNLGASTAGKMGGSEGLVVVCIMKRCLPNALNYPLLEEYDFHNDTINPDLEMELKPQAQPRPYQEESLSRMLGNGPESLCYIVVPESPISRMLLSSCRIKKSCLCVATNAVSLDQWANQFKLWSNIPDERIGQFTYDSKKMFCGDAGVVVHVVPAPMVRKVISVAKSYCKLGLTPTLVREDEKITDLNERGDKIIVLSDNIFALKKYAKKLHKPMVHRGISSCVVDTFPFGWESGEPFRHEVGVFLGSTVLAVGSTCAGDTFACDWESGDLNLTCLRSS
ncbi:DNA repair helicase XPB1 [Tanacetum coccineum]